MSNTNIGTTSFPDEMVSNEKKKSLEFGKEYATAIWGAWESQYYANQKKIKTLRDYANGEQDISDCKKNMAGDYANLAFWEVDWNDKLNILPTLLRNFFNSVDMNELQPVVKAVDPTALNIKNERKTNKMKLYHAKDFIQRVAQSGFSPVPMEQVPDSLEQIELEEQTAEPLKIEKAETFVLEAVARDNMFRLIQDIALREMVVTNLAAAKISSDSIKGITIEPVKRENFVHGETSNAYFTDCPYFGVVKKITVAQFKNIAAESGITIGDEEIRQMAGLASISELTDQHLIPVLFYSFRSYFEDRKVVKKVFSKEVGRKTGAIKLIPEGDYKARENENPEGVVDNYDVWFEGVMCLDAKKTMLRHRLVKNLAEDKYTGKIIPPYIAVKPRYKSIVEEVIPRINSIQELRYRILHFRNTLKGTVTDIDPDMIANVVIGEEKVPPKDVLSMYFLRGIRFRKTVDEDGEPINKGSNIFESDTPIPRALIQLGNEFVTELQLLNQAFGAVQYDQQSPDPKTLGENEPYRFSNNTTMRDYVNALYQWSVNCYQSVSARVYDAMQWKHIRQKFVDAIGTDDVEVIEEFKKNRTNHYFAIYTDLLPTAEEKAKVARRLEYYVTNGILDALDEMEISNVRNRAQQLSMLRLRLMYKQKEMMKMEQQKSQMQVDANTQSTIAAQKAKQETLMMEYQLKMQAEAIEFEHKAFLQQKAGEIKIIEEQIRGESKITAQQYASQYTADLTKFKKEQDAILRKELQKDNQEFLANMTRFRKGKIDDPEQPTTPEVDLSEFNNL